MQSIEVEAKTVEEAIARACKQLQTAADNLSIEVLQETPGKILSLFSGKKAKVRATVKGSGAGHAPRGDQQESLQQLKNIMELIINEIDHNASLEIKNEYDELIFNIRGDGSGIFIGKKGQTLEALQYLVNKMRTRLSEHIPHISVDSEGYRSRHREGLICLAQRLSEKAKKKGGPVTTNPLSAADRRIIHLALKKDAELTTWSKGEGGMRKVIIAPRQ
jgi:spoIIIJ-associated protein